MPKTANVDCITKQPRNDPHHRITAIGGRDGGGWKTPLDRAIAFIESGEWEFFTRPPVGQGQKVIVAVHLGRKYLKTVADHDTPDNLLSLPECP